MKIVKKPKEKKSRLAPAGSIRLLINIPASVHKQLRMLAAREGTTMVALILDALAATGIKS